MMGAFLSRALVYASKLECFLSVYVHLKERIVSQILFTYLHRMVFGYAFPAYKCFKTVETNKPDRDQLLFWCHYWPYVSKHEKRIDDNLEELKNRVATIAIVVWQKAAHYGQARFFEILEYVSSQSASSSRPQSAQAFANKDM
ncbi:hypothetical protein LguiB_022369 [Lonicera macranthoides]